MLALAVTIGLMVFAVAALFGLHLWLRGRWEARPCLRTCLAFWIMTLGGDAAILALLAAGGHWVAFTIVGVLAVGSVLNAAVTVANGGFMPVARRFTAHSVWVPLRPHHRLAWLCDRYEDNYSLGDLLAGAVVPLALRRLRRRWGRGQARLPGMEEE